MRRLLLTKTRALDWHCALTALGLGVVFLLPGGSIPLLAPSFSMLFRSLGQAQWGGIFLVVGAARVAALIINGRLPVGSPALRGLGAALGTVLWAELALTLIDASVRTGAVLPGLVWATAELFSDFFASIRGGIDFGKARRKRAQAVPA